MSKKVKHYIAVDCGSSNGKMIDVTYDGNKIEIFNTAPFMYEPISIFGVQYTDILNIYQTILKNLAGFVKKNGQKAVASIGITTWGSDYGLFDNQGNLISNIYHHRDKRTLKTQKDFFSLVPEDEFFYETGSVYFRGIGLSQLYCDKKTNPLYDQAVQLLGMPGVLSYFLSGKTGMDVTTASTLAFSDISGKHWNDHLFNQLGLRKDFLPTLCEPGTNMGKVTDNVADTIGDKNIDVIAVAGHDTPSGVLAVPGMADDVAFISMGTMMLVGAEVNQPVINKDMISYAFRTVASSGNKYLVYRDVQGFWLLNRCMRSFNKHGQYTFDELERKAGRLPAGRCFVDTDADVFYTGTEDMVQCIQTYCNETNQYVPKSPAEIYRCLLDSYVAKARYSFEALQLVTKRTYSQIRLFNGGSQCILLAKTIAECIGLPVYFGLRYATAVGNALLQMQSMGEVSDLDEIRQLSEKSFEMSLIKKDKDPQWDELYERALSVWRVYQQRDTK